VLHISPGEMPEADRIIAAAFPSYRGRKLKVVVSNALTMSHGWSGGTRDEWRIVRLADHAALSPFDASRDWPRLDAGELPEGAVAVCRSIFCGEDHGVSIQCREDAPLARLLPAPGELPLDVRTVLHSTRSFKASYNGRSDYRFTEARDAVGITRERWEAAKADAIARGLLNKAGAITVAGKNACSLSSSWPKDGAL